VSCQGTHSLENTVQIARHIRCIVLRSSTDGGGLWEGKFRKNSMARFMQYGDCIRRLLPRSERTLLSAARQWRYEAGAPRPTSCPTRHTSASPNECCQPRAVAQRLSTRVIIGTRDRLSQFVNIVVFCSKTTGGPSVKTQGCV